MVQLIHVVVHYWRFILHIIVVIDQVVFRQCCLLFVLVPLLWLLRNVCISACYCGMVWRYGMLYTRFLLEFQAILKYLCGKRLC